jgi:hypothetical protein
VTRTQFAVELGAAADLDSLRSRWTTLKAQHAAALDGLRPLVAVHEIGPKGAIELRLIAGPLANAATAARLCAILSGAGQPCQSGTFDGQQLALR